MSKNKEVIPTNFNVVSPVYDASKAAAHLLGYAIVDGMKFLLNDAGEFIEFGTAVIKRPSDETMKQLKK